MEHFATDFTQWKPATFCNRSPTSVGLHSFPRWLLLTNLKACLTEAKEDKT